MQHTLDYYRRLFQDKTDRVLLSGCRYCMRGEYSGNLLILPFAENEIGNNVAEGELEWWTKRSVSSQRLGLVSLAILMPVLF